MFSCSYHHAEQLTVRRDDDPKFDSEKMTNEYPEEEVTSFDSCQIHICQRKARSKPSVPGQSNGTVSSCKIYRWSTWGSWSSCDKRCTLEGVRRRLRRCEDTCTGAKTEASLCRGQYSSLYQTNLTHTDWTWCSPCPSLERPTWSEWADWRITETYQQYCGLGVLTKQRSRLCLPGKGKTGACSGEKTERMTVPRPSCRAQHTSQDYFSADTEVR